MGQDRVVREPERCLVADGMHLVVLEPFQELGRDDAADREPDRHVGKEPCLVVLGQESCKERLRADLEPERCLVADGMHLVVLEQEPGDVADRGSQSGDAVVLELEPGDAAGRGSQSGDAVVLEMEPGDVVGRGSQSGDAVVLELEPGDAADLGSQSGLSLIHI